MISIKRVNNTSELGGLFLTLLESYIEDNNNVIESTVNNIIKEEADMLFESSVLDTDAKRNNKLNEGSKNIFTKIGEVALTISKKIIEYINKVIKTIKDIGFRLKSDEKKLELIAAKNPKYADAIISKINNNELAIADIKGLADIDKLYNEIIEMSKKKDVDPSTLRGKSLILIEKMKDIDKSALVSAAKATTAVLAVATCILTIKKHKQDIEKSNLDLQKRSKESYEAFLKAYEELKKQGSKDEFVNPDILSKAQIIQNIQSMYQGKISNLVSANEKSMNKLIAPVNAFIKKFDNAGTLIKGLEMDLAYKNNK